MTYQNRLLIKCHFLAYLLHNSLTEIKIDRFYVAVNRGSDNSHKMLTRLLHMTDNFPPTQPLKKHFQI